MARRGHERFQVTFTVAIGTDGVMRANIRTGSDDELNTPSNRWHWARGHLTLPLLNDMSVVAQDIVYRELLMRYGSQGSLID